MNDDSTIPGADTASASTQGAKEKFSETAQRAGEKVASRLDMQKDRAAEGLGNFAKALRQSSDRMRGDREGDGVDGYVSSAADQIERMSDYLKSRSTRDIVGNVERFAREQPALFVGGALVLGLIGARFLKSSSASVSRPEYGRDARQAEPGGGYDSAYSSRSSAAQPSWSNRDRAGVSS